LAISKEKKRDLVAHYADMLQRSQGIVITEYSGMNMAHLTALRAKLREVGGGYTITKNTLLKLALQGSDMAVPEDLLLGPVAVAFAFEDMPSTAKVLLDEAREEEGPLLVKGGVIGQSVLSPAELEQLTELPPMETLRAQLLGLIATPATGIVTLLQEPARSVVGALNAASSQLLNVLAAYAAKSEEAAA
jgi:large subunit ribosomal protein L10